MNLMNILLLIFLGYMIYNIYKMQKQSKKQKQLLSILDLIPQEEAFFKAADEFIETNDDPIYVAKISVLRLWGDVFYERQEEYYTHLEDLNIDVLMEGDRKNDTFLYKIVSSGIQNKGFSANEDSFFYLYMAIPNRLWSKKLFAMRKKLDEKLEPYAEGNEGTLLKRLYDENKKFYDKSEDCGKGFMQDLQEGNYSGYQYNKQLIGLYKQCEEALLACIVRDEGDYEAYEEMKGDLKTFSSSRLGERWLKECGIEIKDEEEESDDTEEENTEEVYEAVEEETK